MTRAPAVVALSALLLALTSCTGEPSGTTAAPSAPASTPAAASSPAFDNGAVCSENADAANAGEADIDATIAIGNDAAKSDDPGVARAGVDLITAAVDARSNDDKIEAALGIDRAQLALAQACADLLGDGPWK